MEDIIIKESTRKTATMIILGFFISLGSIYVLVGGIIEISVVLMIIGLISTTLFCFCFFYIIKTTLNKKPILVIGKDGIIEMSTASSVGFVAWEEIESLLVFRVFAQKFIGINVYDLDKLMTRISPIKQMSVKANLLFRFPPLAISLETADGKFNEVLSIMQKRLKEHNS